MKLNPNTWYNQKSSDLIFKYEPLNWVFIDFYFIQKGKYYEKEMPAHHVDMLAKKDIEVYPNPQTLELLYGNKAK